jgi:V/A-type H+-transporting ATPase subunit E
MSIDKTDSPAPHAEATASGVEELIRRLRSDGVEAGREEAQRIIHDAENRANWLVEQAKAEADELLADARNETDRFRASAEEALQVAARDAVLQMKDQLTQQFSDEIGRLVSGEMHNAALLERLILELAGRVRQSAGLDDEPEVELLLPEGALDLADLRDDPDELRHGDLSHLVIDVAGDMLRKGVTLTPSRQVRDGIRIRLNEKRIEIDMSSEAIAQHLLEHLLPRFRALLEGMVY